LIPNLVEGAWGFSSSELSVSVGCFSSSGIISLGFSGMELPGFGAGSVSGFRTESVSGFCPDEVTTSVRGKHPPVSLAPSSLHSHVSLLLLALVLSSVLLGYNYSVTEYPNPSPLFFFLLSLHPTGSLGFLDHRFLVMGKLIQVHPFFFL